MIIHILSCFAFVAVTLVVQGSSHMKINKSHFDQISFMRCEPIFLMGMIVMAIQGLVMSIAMELIVFEELGIFKGLLVSLGFGVFLVAYISTVEPAKYKVPSITRWFGVESSAGFLQFSIYGLLLGYIHQVFT